MDGANMNIFPSNVCVWPLLKFEAVCKKEEWELYHLERFEILKAMAHNLKVM